MQQTRKNFKVRSTRDKIELKLPIHITIKAPVHWGKFIDKTFPPNIKFNSSIWSQSLLVQGFLMKRTSSFSSN